MCLAPCRGSCRCLDSKYMSDAELSHDDWIKLVRSPVGIWGVVLCQFCKWVSKHRHSTQDTFVVLSLPLGGFLSCVGRSGGSPRPFPRSLEVCLWYTAPEIPGVSASQSMSPVSSTQQDLGAPFGSTSPSFGLETTSQAVSWCCPVSENDCFIYFVYSSSRSGMRVNLVPASGQKLKKVLKETEVCYSVLMLSSQSWKAGHSLSFLSFILFDLIGNVSSSVLKYKRGSAYILYYILYSGLSWLLLATHLVMVDMFIYLANFILWVFFLGLIYTYVYMLFYERASTVLFFRLQTMS